MKVIAIWQLTSPSFYLHVFAYYPNPKPTKKSTFGELMALLGILSKSAFLFSSMWRTLVMACIFRRYERARSPWLKPHWSHRVSFLEFWRCNNRRRISERCHWCPAGEWRCLRWRWISRVYRSRLQEAKVGKHWKWINATDADGCDLLRNVCISIYCSAPCMWENGFSHSPWQRSLLLRLWLGPHWEQSEGRPAASSLDRSVSGWI